MAKKYVKTRTYSSSNAAAHDPEERVQLNKPKHYHNIQNWTREKEQLQKKEKRAERTSDWPRMIQISRQKP